MQGFSPTNRHSTDRTVNLLRLVPFAVLALVFLYQSGAQLRQTQRRAEQEMLQSLTALLGLPMTASKEEVFARLTVYRATCEEAHRAHIAEKVGLATDWKRIFARIERLKRAQQVAMQRTIADEYGFPPETPLNQIKIIVNSRERAFRAGVVQVNRPGPQRQTLRIAPIPFKSRPIYLQERLMPAAPE